MSQLERSDDQGWVEDDDRNRTIEGECRAARLRTGAKQSSQGAGEATASRDTAQEGAQQRTRDSSNGATHPRQQTADSKQAKSALQATPGGGKRSLKPAYERNMASGLR